MPPPLLAPLLPLLACFSSVSSLRVLDAGDRKTSLYHGPAIRGKQGMIITARPSTHRMEQLKFHLLDCVAGQPCSQAIPGDPEFSHIEKDGEVQYNGHASPGISDASGLFSVIEDQFYKERVGSPNSLPMGNRRKDSVYPQRQEQDSFLRPEVQTVPGYSSLMETRLGVAEERISRTPAPVSVASSHGRVRGPEYPRRPNLAPATLRPITRPTPPSRDRWRENEYDVRLRQEEERRSKEREDEQRRKDDLDRRTWSYKQEKERNGGNSIRTPSRQKDKTKGATDFYLRKERYDPFAFQSTPKPKEVPSRGAERYASAASSSSSRSRVAHRGAQQPSSSVIAQRGASSSSSSVAHRLDSRFSVPLQEPAYVSRKEEPLVISFQEAIKARQGTKARRKRPEDQEAQSQQFSLQYIRPERKESSYYNTRKPVVGYSGGANPIFVSLNKEENKRAPTPPPRQYYPGSSPSSSSSYFSPSPPTRQPYADPRLDADFSQSSYLNNRVDEEEEEITQRVYSPPYQSTQPSVEQQKFWQQSLDLLPPEPQWPGYGHLVDSLLRGEATGQAYGISGKPPQEDSPYIVKPSTYKDNKLKTGGRRTGLDTNKYVGGPQRISTQPIVVGPGLGEMPRLRGSGSQRRQEEESDQLWSQREEAETRWRQRQQLQPPNDMLSSYSDRYGWTQQAVPPRSPPRNWTSLDLAKPLWEEEEGKGGDISLKDFKQGQVQQLDLEEVGAPGGGGKKTYGTWDQSLNLSPAMSRSTEPRPKQWILLARSRSVEEEGEGTSREASTSLAVDVDGSKFAAS